MVLNLNSNAMMETTEMEMDAAALAQNSLTGSVVVVHQVDQANAKNTLQVKSKLPQKVPLTLEE